MWSYIIAILVILASMILFLRAQSSSSRSSSPSSSAKNSVLVLGAVGSGKTALLYRLKQGVFRRTVTSQRLNREECTVGDVAKAAVVDFPGHGSQRYRLDKALGAARAVAFLVDATSVEKMQDLSEFLFSVLSSPLVVRKRMPVFVGFTKVDRDDAKSSDAMRGHLEAHIERLRKAQGDMSDIGGERVADQHVDIGEEGEAFRFEHHPCDVKFGRLSAKSGQVADFVAFVESVYQ